MEPERFLDWIASKYNFYAWLKLSEAYMVQFTTTKLNGPTYKWWQERGTYMI